MQRLYKAHTSRTETRQRLYNLIPLSSLPPSLPPPPLLPYSLGGNIGVEGSDHKALLPYSLAQQIGVEGPAHKELHFTFFFVRGGDLNHSYG